MHEGHRQRLRERYLNGGLDAFADHEVLELLLTYVIPRQDTNPLAHTLLNRFGSLQAVLCAQVAELTQIAGIGERTAVFLKLQGDLQGALHIRAAKKERTYIHSPNDAALFCMDLIQGERYESVYVVSLNQKRQVQHAERLFSGTLTETPLYARQVVESALNLRAHAIILVHNHPSGDPTPSGADLEATKAIELALLSIQIQIFDHIIVGRNIVYSCKKAIFIDRAKQAYASYFQALDAEKTGMAACKAAEKN